MGLPFNPDHETIEERDIKKEEEIDSNGSYFDDVFYDAAGEDEIQPKKSEKEETKGAMIELDYRTTLPAKRNPKQKVSIWTILKDLIGKDITRFSLPGNFL